MTAFQSFLVIGCILVVIGGLQSVRRQVDGEGAGSALVVLGLGGAALLYAHFGSPHGVSLPAIVSAFAALARELQALAR
ncbi:hypothetical protein ACQ5SO_06550 [Rhodovulum sp. DZ06]|uniref:hypothetical protein n=1 Tax=Rhodovulum sp. DZ06 TaxID=3425126 RepID=UPI003D32AC48